VKATTTAGARGDIKPRETGRNTIEQTIVGLERMRDSLGDSFDAAVQALLDSPGKVLTLGIGKSGIAAQKVAATFRSVGLPALYLNASDSLHGDIGVVGPEDVALLFSKSGMTRELLVLLPHLRARNVTLIAVVGDPRSTLARESEVVLDTFVEREGCPLDCSPMASVTAAQTMGDALAAAVMEARGLTTEDFARLHPAGALGARTTLSVADVMRTGKEHPVVERGATLKEAVLEITRTGFGAVCVVEDDELAGLITDGDIRRLLVQHDNLAAVPVEEVMTRDPLTVEPRYPLSQALIILEQRRKPFLTAPVVEGRRCVGLLRLHDAVQAHLKP
jgi:arabinose-5-phosphate isomerase